MTLFEIVGLYVALNAILFVWLTLRVVAVRRREKISLGDNEDSNLRKRIRSQANFTETAPIALIGLLALAALGAANWALHFFGAALTIGRGLHGYGMMGKNAVGPGRPLGMLMTLLVVLGQALYLAYLIFVT